MHAIAVATKREQSIFLIWANDFSFLVKYLQLLTSGLIISSENNFYNAGVCFHSILAAITLSALLAAAKKCILIVSPFGRWGV